jgi:hypothetical protein
MLCVFPKSFNAAVIASGVSVSMMAPLIAVLPATAQTNFSDVSISYWARSFIEKLAEKNVIKGFPDGTFKPDEPVTRAQFAAIIRQAFERPSSRQYRDFADVPRNHWAQPAISKAYSTRFMSGYPGNLFEPNQEIPKVQALVSLSSGLGLEPKTPTDKALATYKDANDIPDYAGKQITAATEAGFVVNYPDVKFLNPNEQATRAEIAAFVYQALVNQGDLEPIAKDARANGYIVKLEGTPVATNPTTPPATTPPTTTPPTPPPANTNTLVASGTVIPVKYPGSTKVNLIVAPGETVATRLEVATDVTNAAGTVLIPKGSLIEGRLVPISVNNTTPGTQFVAEQLKIGPRTYSLRATSNPQVAVAPQAVKPTDLRGAIGTTAARTILGPGFDLASVLTGAVLGSNSANNASAKESVIVIDPAALKLTTQADLSLTS